MALWIYETPLGELILVEASTRKAAAGRFSDPSAKKLRQWPPDVPFKFHFSVHLPNGEDSAAEWRVEASEAVWNVIGDADLAWGVAKSIGSTWRKDPGRVCGTCGRAGHNRRTCVERKRKRLNESGSPKTR